MTIPIANPIARQPDRQPDDLPDRFDLIALAILGILGILTPNS